MGREVRLNAEESFNDERLLVELKKSAERYNRYANKKVLFIYRKDMKPSSEYMCYEVLFGEENFIHLAGFQSDKIDASTFFTKCLLGTLSPKELTFKESRKAASSKLSILPELLDYHYVKLYMIGKKNLETLKNKFEVGLGNYQGIIGFDKRNLYPPVPIPVTAMKRPLQDYVSNPMKILAILMKNKTDISYNTVVACVTSGIEVSDLPKYISEKIDGSLYPKIVKSK